MTNIRITGIADVNRVLREIAPNEARNLMRATTAQLAKSMAQDAKRNTPVKSGAVKGGITHDRRNTRKDIIRATVGVIVDKKKYGPFYWRFLEFGQGPDGVEHAMFMKALMAANSDLEAQYLRIFTDKLVRRLASKAKAAAKAKG